MYRNLFILLFGLFSMASSQAQMTLTNPSFENKPQDATCPSGWHPCKMGSTPDILPGFWGVYNESAEGNTYLGLITRDDGSWESIGQRLKKGVKKGECYKFQFDVAHSKKYEGYNLPVRLRIWGGTTRCAKDQLIGEVGPVKSSEWKHHEFQFYANKKINYIIIEAYYMKGLMVPYKGNILLDNISDFQPCIRASVEVEERVIFPRG